MPKADQLIVTVNKRFEMCTLSQDCDSSKLETSIYLDNKENMLTFLPANCHYSLLSIISGMSPDDDDDDDVKMKNLQTMSLSPAGKPAG